MGGCACRISSQIQQYHYPERAQILCETGRATRRPAEPETVPIECCRRDTEAVAVHFEIGDVRWEHSSDWNG